MARPGSSAYCPITLSCHTPVTAFRPELRADAEGCVSVTDGSTANGVGGYDIQLSVYCITKSECTVTCYRNAIHIEN